MIVWRKNRRPGTSCNGVDLNRTMMITGMRFKNLHLFCSRVGALATRVVMPIMGLDRTETQNTVNHFR